MKVREIMSRNVGCIEPDTSIKEAAEEMRLLDVGFCRFVRAIASWGP